MEKFREIMKGEHPVDYAAVKNQWKVDNDPKIDNKIEKATNPLPKQKEGEFRPRMLGEDAIDYSIAKREFKLNNK